jgi:hypothetical protein
MKVALIPPKGYFGVARDKSKYHLMLAQIKDPDYYRLYAYLDNSHYIILDNGAAEGGSIGDDELLHAATMIGVDEIVVPDVIGDFKATIARGDEFILKFKDSSKASTNLMMVAQGQTQAEVKHCVDYYLVRFPDAAIGIPRHLLTTLGQPKARGEILNYIEHQFHNVVANVHLLGTNSMWPTEIEYLAKNYPWVRGIDSSMPFNYSIAGESLELTRYELAHVDRPEDYFSTAPDIDPELLESNVDTFMRWASGTEGTAR